MIQQSGPRLDSILFSFCRFDDENFGHIFHALEQHKANHLKVLHYGFLHKDTVPVFARSISGFHGLIELGVGFHEDIEAFELFCKELAYNVTIKTLDIQLFKLHHLKDVVRFLKALAILIPKLPNLGSITTVYTYHKTPVVENAPVELLASLDTHKNLVNFVPQIPFADTMVQYYLTRNRFRDRLAAKKPIMIEALKALDNDNPIPLSLVKDTLCSRDDWLLPGVDQGKPLPSTVKVRTFRRFQPGPLF